MKMIEVNHLRFKYRKNDKAVLNDLSFGVERGTVNVLIGLNGSGKTTLIKTLAGLLDGYSGEILIDGKDLSQIKIPDRAKIVSYVAQRNGTIDDFLVREYLLFARVGRLHFYESPRAIDEREMEKCAERFGFTHLLNKRLGEISGGERQIVSICSAILQDTDIVILDEPTSALDIKNQHMVLSIIKSIATERDKTFVLSSHNPNHALFLESNVILLQDGKISISGPSSEIITPSTLKTVYGDSLCLSCELPYKEVSFKAN